MTDEEITAMHQDLQAAKSELETTKTEVDSLNSQLSERDAKMGELQSAITEKTALADSQEQELSTLRTAGAAAEERIAELSGNLTEAISKYKDRLYSANPELLENMITGETIQEIDESLGSALLLVDKVKAHVAEQSKAVNVPAGSPERTGTPDFIGAMSAKEKIAYAIGKEAN
ncbi:MAG: hypothetical protein KAS54_05215 [Dehalococcoidia bacterium]|nr:hypothetical protein [Dehalococcoidia bacterium]